jgi:nitrate reductase NapE component
MLWDLLLSSWYIPFMHTSKLFRMQLPRMAVDEETNGIRTKKGNWKMVFNYIAVVLFSLILILIIGAYSAIDLRTLALLTQSDNVNLHNR